MRLVLVFFVALACSCDSKQAPPPAPTQPAGPTEEQKAAYAAADAEYKKELAELDRLKKELDKQTAPFRGELSKVNGLIADLEGNIKRLNELGLAKKTGSAKRSIAELEEKRDKIRKERDDASAEVREQVEQQKMRVEKTMADRDALRW